MQLNDSNGSEQRGDSVRSDAPSAETPQKTWFDGAMVDSEALQAGLRADPEKARTILQHRGDRVLREPLIGAERLEMKIARRRLGAGARDEHRGGQQRETRRCRAPAQHR